MDKRIIALLLAAVITVMLAACGGTEIINPSSVDTGTVESAVIDDVKTEDVDLSQMLIRYKTTSVPIYREAIPAFKNAVTLTNFLYKHPNYTKPIRRDRVPGDTIMRGLKATTKTFTMRTTISKRNISAIEDGLTELQLSFYRVRMSGLFYRTYEMERAGIPVTFSEAALRVMDGKTYALSGREKIIHKQNRIERDYFDDYQRWKLAFSI